MVSTITPIYESTDDAMLSGCGSFLPELVVESAYVSAFAFSPTVTSSSSSPSPHLSPPSPSPPPPPALQSEPETAPTVITMRPMGIDDVDQVRELHEQWFPIRYQQSFYEGAAQGIWRETGFPLFTRLASEPPPQPQQHTLNNATTRDAYGFVDWPQRQPQTPVYGAVMASTIPLTSVEDSGLLAADDFTHTHVMYILTLGSRASMRRRGLASALLAQCVEEARRQPRCGAVYLHVKADNTSALRFYEKNGFQNLRYLEDYYVIDGVRHSAYLYILYVNGAVPHNGWLELLTRPIMALFSFASYGFKRLLVGLTEEAKHNATPNKHGAPPSTVPRRRPAVPRAPLLVDDSHVNRLAMASPPSSPHVISVV